MCQFVSFKCVYKGILSELQDAGSAGMAYDDLRERVPNNGSIQFLKQFRHAISSGEIVAIDENGELVAEPYSYGYGAPHYMFKWTHSSHALPLVLKALEKANERIAELEGKLTQAQQILCPRKAS